MITENVYHRLAEFYVPSLSKGIVQLHLVDHSDLDCSFHLFEQVKKLDGVNSECDATIVMPFEILEKILAFPEKFEPRSPDFLDGVSISGDLNLIHYFTQLLKRPMPDIRNVFELIRSRDYQNVNSVKVTDFADPEIILESIIKSQPLLMKGILDWESRNWTLDDLDLHLGHCHLRKNPLTGKEEKFRDFINLMKDSSNNDRVYTNGFPLPDHFYNLFTFPFFESKDFRPIQIWLGRKRENKLITKLHCDWMSSVLGQIWGRKRLYLYSPDQYKYLYPMESYNVYQPCHIDPTKVDAKEYPLFQNAKALDITVDAGDVLIIPAGWFHCVFALDDVFSISRFMKQEVAEELYSNLSLKRCVNE